jgi:hypothetical protein
MLFDTQALQRYGVEYGDGIKCFEAFDTDKVWRSALDILSAIS